MKKICILILTMLLLLCGCNFEEQDTFRDHLDEIASVQIIEITDYGSTANTFEESVVGEISDIEAFKEDLLDIDSYTYFGGPVRLEVGDVVIKLTYNSGDYDLLNNSAQLKRRNDRYNYGHTTFDQQQFEALIGKYLVE